MTVTDRSDSVPAAAARVRMTRDARHTQLLDVSRELFAAKGFDNTSIEEIAASARVSKPVVYEHFVTKERLIAAVVDREMEVLLLRITGALTGDSPQDLLTSAVTSFLCYIEDNEDGFRVLLRQSPDAEHRGRFANVLAEIATSVEDGFARAFTDHGEDPRFGPVSAQMLVGMVAFAGQFWLDARLPDRDAVAAHIVRMAWCGLSDMVDVVPPARTATD